jgi:hypothetical protein
MTFWANGVESEVSAEHYFQNKIAQMDGRNPNYYRVDKVDPSDYGFDVSLMLDNDGPPHETAWWVARESRRLLCEFGEESRCSGYLGEALYEHKVKRGTYLFVSFGSEFFLTGCRDKIYESYEISPKIETSSIN